jgi:hypothetical protein
VSWECPERKKGGETHISKAHKRDVEAEGAEDGRSLMMKKVLLKQEPETEKTSAKEQFVQNNLQNEAQSLQGDN